MKLEHLPNAHVNGGDDLIRLFDFTASEVNVLIDLIRDDLILEGKALQLDILDFINPLNCKMMLAMSETDGGIRMKDSGDFRCDLTKQGFLRMLELMAPFAEESTTGYQWLYDLPAKSTRTEFLLSRNGKW